MGKHFVLIHEALFTLPGKVAEGLIKAIAISI